MDAALQQVSDQFYDALNAVFAGDVEPMLELWSHADDVTYMSPFGELLVGWEPIRASWQAQADQHLDGSVHPEQLHGIAAPTLGCVVGFERGTVQIDGTSSRVDIRATSLYRLEDGRWAMIGHHTDPLG